MKVGTPSFQGARLRQVRISLGLTQESLGLMLGYQDSTTVSSIENGSDSPSPEVFQRLMSITRQPVQFFITPPPSGLDTNRMFFRSMRSLDEIARARAEIKLIWLAEYVRYLSEYVDFPSVNLPDFSEVPKDPLEITDMMIRQAALDLRKHWKLGKGPLPNIVNLLESNGFIIHFEAFGSHKWDAVSFWDDLTSTPLILVNTDKPSYFRLRFNLLHELFHLLFHRHLDPSLKNSKKYQKTLEDQAHLFAGEMSLTHDSFPQDLYAHNLDALRVIKSKWKMSIGAMIHRLDDLKILDKDEGKKLWANYRRRWRAEEPLDDKYDHEKPTVIHATLELLKDNDVISPESLISESVFSYETQESFAAMGVDFWQQRNPVLKIHKLYG